MLIRIAQVSDASELNKLNSLFNGQGCSSIESAEESLKANEQEIVCVAADGSRLIGFCCGQIFRSVCYSYIWSEITELFVMNEYRRQGIGRQLLEFIERELMLHGVKHNHILTGKDNKTAQTLYLSCGYGETSEILLDKDL